MPNKKTPKSTEPTTYLEAIRQTLFEEMRRDKSVFCIGEDIGKFGGAFKVTKGLLDEFGADRVIDTPIAESGLTALGIGASFCGLRPVIEMQFADFVSNAFTQLAYNAAKSHYRWNQPVPIVVRLPVGGGIHGGPFHSTNPEAWFSNVPGLKIVAPSTPTNARGLLKASIRDDNPVLYLEHKYLYRRVKEVLPPDDGVVEIGKARIALEGSDVTVITYGAMVQHALEAAAKLQEVEGASIEILDLQSLIPWDEHLVTKSIKKTGRALVLYEATRTGGFGAEIAATIAEKAFEYLDAPLVRLASHDTPVPFAPPLEQFFMPGPEDIASSLKRLLDY
jgi:2-oxoisovalerate dehydrogenase E1 component beta subunit